MLSSDVVGFGIVHNACKVSPAGKVQFHCHRGKVLKFFSGGKRSACRVANTDGGSWSVGWLVGLLGDYRIQLMM